MGQLARDNQSDPQIGWLIDAATRMIRPLVRFAIGRISCNALINLVRETYVLEARTHLERSQPDRKVTRSALALLCGMDGRAIKFFEENEGRSYSPSDVCSEAAILEMWKQDSAFCDNDSETDGPRMPARLLIHGPQGTFQQLVRKAAGRNVTSQTVLERLLESGNIELVDDDTRVQLIDPIYMPVKASERTAIDAASFAFNRLGKAVVHNTRENLTSSERWLQQDRWSTRIPIASVARLRRDIRPVVERHIKEIEDFLEAWEAPSGEGEFSWAGVGWYYWEDAQGE